MTHLERILLTLIGIFVIVLYGGIVSMCIVEILQ